MRLKLTLQRDRGRPAADLVINIDPAARIGDLADFLATADPLNQKATAHGDRTIAVTAPGSRNLRPDTAVGDSGLASGVTVRVIPASGRISNPAEAPAVLRVVGGPEAGREFPLRDGPNIVGRGRDCDVRLDDPMTSRRHAKIQVGDSVEISDLGSSNGVLVADSPVQVSTLQPGETAQLGDSVIAVDVRRREAESPPQGNAIAFNRPPLTDRCYAGRTFRLPEIPSAPKAQRFPMIPLFAPLVMGSALYATTRSTTSLIFMGMSPLMMAGNVLEGQLASRRTHRRELADFQVNVDQMCFDVGEALKLEAEARLREAPSLAECNVAIRSRSSLLWSRRPGRPGFGEIRLGLGAQRSRNLVEFPLQRQGEAGRLRELHSSFDHLATVNDVPVVASMDEAGTLGIAGDGARVRDVARACVLQLAALHSHREFALYAVCGSHRVNEWEWMKWLPHCGGTDSPLDCEALASNTKEVAALLGALDALIRGREDGARSSGPSLPRIAVIVDEPTEARWSRLVELAERGAKVGVWFLFVASSLAALPSCASAYVDLGQLADGAEGASAQTTGGNVSPLSTEGVSAADAELVARVLAPVVDASAGQDGQSDVPRSISMLALVGQDLATAPERVIERWVENRSVLTGACATPPSKRVRPGNLRAVLGETATGPHVLDLRADGPHALVGGTTGAGKSELLQSWIIGMALSNSPQRLTFLLVDYKGGSAFSDCVNLPHTVGLVTDLSPHLVRRALTALAAELRYRERILHRKRAKDLASLERVGDPEAPPSLVIVVDEFAALVQEVPAFVDGVVNVAQRGRSLGLHLILATQRPSGVIRDNLRANTNLRIALRMADVTDSTDVIGSKMAAGFDPAIPGRATSRTGPTALVPFQTAYVGGWTSSTPARPDIAVSTWGFGAGQSWEPPADESTEQPSEGPTDIQRLVSNLRQASAAAGLAEPRKPWLPELECVYDLVDLPLPRRDDELVFAMADDPGNQQQTVMSFQPDANGNIAIFGTGNSGKSTLLRTLAIAAGITIRSGPVHVYGLDFGARGLQMLEQLPHVGSIIPGGDVERVSRVLAMLRDTVDSRAHTYASVGAGSITEYRKLSGRSDEPRILLLVDGMGALRSAFEGTENHRLYEMFLSLAADGRPVGVNVLVTADRAGAVPTALSALIQRRVVLRLASENDYTMLGQPNDILDAKSPPGRALCDGLEIQVAVLGGSADLLVQDIEVRKFAASMEAAGLQPAPAIRRLEGDIDLDDISAALEDSPVFAISGDSLGEAAFAPQGTFTVAGPPGSGRTTTLLTLATALRRWRPNAKLALVGAERSFLSAGIDWDWEASGVEQGRELATKLPELLGDAKEEPPALVVIEELANWDKGLADSALQDMIRKVTAAGHLVASEGEPGALSSLSGLMQAARASRVGVVLQPEQADGYALFRAQFPRVRRADFVPGRGIYVARGVQPVIVQVAKPGSSPH